MKIKKSYIFISARPVGTKLDMTVAYNRESQTKESYVFLITWSIQVTWQKNLILYLHGDGLWEDVTTHNGRMTIRFMAT